MKENKYRLQKREYSSNVIERKVQYSGKERWKCHIVPTERKELGDKIAKDLLSYLNSK